MSRHLVVRDLETAEEVHRINITGKGERAIEKTERGLLRNMNLERFYVEDTGLEKP